MFIAEFLKVTVIHPDVLVKLELADEARPDHESRYAALHAVLRRILRQRRAIGCAAADQPSAVHIFSSVAKIHAAYMRTQWYRISKWIHLFVVKVVVPLHIGA